jgi:DNA-binding transcriptional ArsR family regulator
MGGIGSELPTQTARAAASRPHYRRYAEDPRSYSSALTRDMLLFGHIIVADDLDAVFKALADPTRRMLLDLLHPGPRTTGWLCEQFPRLSRFAVMKHLGLLEAAGLITVRREGRERYNALNPVPLRRVYERWMSPLLEQSAVELLRLKDAVEGPAKPKPIPKGGT